MDKELLRLVDALKRRKAFVSFVMTRTRIDFSWWDGSEVRTGDADSVKLWLRAQEENDRREIIRISRRMGAVL